MLKFDDYERIWEKTAIYPNKGKNWVYPALKLCGETGEVAEKLGKVMRDENSVLTREKKEELIKELGDVLWYITALAIEFDSSLEEVAHKNWAKLLDRAERDVLHGSGDNR